MLVCTATPHIQVNMSNVSCGICFVLHESIELGIQSVSLKYNYVSTNILAAQSLLRFFFSFFVYPFQQVQLNTCCPQVLIGIAEKLLAKRRTFSFGISFLPYPPASLHSILYHIIY